MQLQYNFIYELKGPVATYLKTLFDSYLRNFIFFGQNRCDRLVGTRSPVTFQNIGNKSLPPLKHMQLGISLLSEPLNYIPELFMCGDKSLVFTT